MVSNMKISYSEADKGWVLETITNLGDATSLAETKFEKKILDIESHISGHLKKIEKIVKEKLKKGA